VLKRIYLSAALIWTCSILFLCLASFSNLPEVGVKNADKYVHFTFHFVFVNLWFLYFNHKKQNNSIKLALFIFISSVIFGVLIELAQRVFTTSRKADFLDILSNAIGAFSALILFLIYYFVIKSKPKLQ
jgi:VanZ family protein